MFFPPVNKTSSAIPVAMPVPTAPPYDAYGVADVYEAPVPVVNTLPLRVAVASRSEKAVWSELKQLAKACEKNIDRLQYNEVLSVVQWVVGVCDSGYVGMLKPHMSVFRRVCALLPESMQPAGFYHALALAHMDADEYKKAFDCMQQAMARVYAQGASASVWLKAYAELYGKGYLATGKAEYAHKAVLLYADASVGMSCEEKRALEPELRLYQQFTKELSWGEVTRLFLDAVRKGDSFAVERASFLCVCSVSMEHAADLRRCIVMAVLHGHGKHVMEMCAEYERIAPKDAEGLEYRAWKAAAQLQAGVLDEHGWGEIELLLDEVRGDDLSLPMPLYKTLAAACGLSAYGSVHQEWLLEYAEAAKQWALKGPLPRRLPPLLR